jgi:hypothetical protein
MSVHSGEIIQSGERISFLPPPAQEDDVPSLQLLLTHFVPMDLIPSTYKMGAIQFSLQPLIDQCLKKIKDMVNMTVYAKVPGKRRWGSEVDDVKQVEIGRVVVVNPRPSAKRVKVNDVRPTIRDSFAIIYSFL